MMIKKKKIAGGLSLILVPMKGTKTITALAVFKTGSKYETRSLSGLSHFVEHMMFKGTKKRPNAFALSSELDSIGGEYNAFTSKEYTGYYIKADGRKLTKALDVLSDMLTNSQFSQEEIDKERGVIIEEANMYESNPMMKIEDVFEQLLYGDTPAGWDTIGTKENIRNFSRSDFVRYFETQYGRSSATLILSGNLPGNTEILAAKYFNVLKKNNWQDKRKVVEKQKTPGLLIINKSSEQVNFSLGVRACSVGSSDELAVKLLAVILGGSMSSRLFSEVREKRGLAYYIRSNAEIYSDSGYLTTEAGVRIDKTEEAIRAILTEYKRLKEELVSARELKKALDLITGRLAIQLESSDDVANWYGRQVILRNQLITPEEYLKQVKKISSLDLQRVAKKIFRSNRLNLALIGPRLKKDNLQKIIKEFR